MIEIEDREYFDVLYQGWSKTTGASDMYWQPEACEAGASFELFAVNEKQERKHVASFLSEEDSAFIVAAHGSIPDLIRRLHSALDEADRLDRVLDEEIGRVGDQVLEILELKQIIADLEGRLAEKPKPSFERDYTAYHAAGTVYPFGREV